MILGEVKGDLALESSLAEPASIEVSGARSEVAKLTQLVTDPIDVSALTESKVVTLGISTANLPSVSLNANQVKVSLVVGPKKSIRTISFVPVGVEGSTMSSSVHPLSISLLIRAPDAMIANFTADDFKATVAAKDLVPGRYDLDIKVKGPDGTIIQEINPKKASVVIFNHKKRE